MKDKNREELQRAVGIVEGVSFCVSKEGQDALCTAIEIIDEVLRDEEATTYETSI